MAKKLLLEVVRTVYMRRLSGVVEVQVGAQPTRLRFRQGEMFVARDHPSAEALGQIVSERAAGQQQRHSEPLLLQMSEEIGRGYAAWVSQPARFLLGAEGDCVGPLSTARVVMKMAVHGCDNGRLMARLGGPGVRLRSEPHSPAMRHLRRLDPTMARLLEWLAKPQPVSDLLGGQEDTSDRLRALVQLWSVGLVIESQESEARSPTIAPGGLVLTEKLLRRFSDRIAEDLSADPLDVARTEHRQQLANLLGNLGELSHYDLLKVAIKAETPEIHAAYNELGRLVHPSHAAALGLAGREAALQVLFERATEAYLTLSDPRRRSSYNLLTDMPVQVKVDRQKRDEERQQLAVEHYRRATQFLSAMDYSIAVDLLKEAVRLDPQARYFALLGQAQAKNPRWFRHALGNYKQAAELDPDDAGIRAAFGELLERMERFSEARTQYQSALRLMPDHVGAEEGLGRLGGVRLAKAGSKVRGGLRGLFGRSGED